VVELVLEWDRTLKFYLRWFYHAIFRFKSYPAKYIRGN